MRKLFTFLATMVLAIVALPLKAVNYEIDQRFTSVDDLAGQAFAIVNEADGNKVIFGSGAQNLGYDVFSAAFASTNSGYFWKTELSSVDGHHLLRLQTPAGQPYSIWGNPGYLNSQPATGSVSFVLGLLGDNKAPDYPHTEGQDGDYLATWKITYVEDKGFTLLNKATGLYLASNGPANSEEPVYWTFCTIKEAANTDPLATQKEELTAAITKGGWIPAFAYTNESFTTLSNAVAAGSDALENEGATAESLTNAKTNIEDAIKDLELKAGYTILTADMFKTWDSATEPTEGTAATGNYILNESTDQPFGEGNVYYLNFANLAEYDKLFVTFAEGTPRLMMNRDVNDGQWNETETDSHLIDNTKNGWHNKYFTTEDGVITVDLAQLVTDKGIANLNAIKGANFGNTNVTGLYLFTATNEPTPATYAITIADGIENGTVVADPTEAAEGETVTLTITPAANYELESLSVKNGEEDIEVAEGYTFLMPAAAVTVSASFKAKEPVIAPGKYYIQNVSTGLYWGAGNNWGTQASLLAHPDYVTLVSNEDGTYKIESLVNNGGKYFFDGEWMDGVAKPVTITKAGDYYTFSNGTTFYGANPEGKATTFEGTMILGTPAGDSQEALWKVISEEEMAAKLATATESNPVDATYLIADHTFGRNHRLVNAWTNEGGAALTGGNSDKHDAEKYHGAFNVYQKLAGAPAGVYKFSAQGFYRQDGSDNDNLPVFYANEETSTFPLKTGTENSMKDACTSFEAGKYLIEPIYVQVTEAGELTVGAKLVTNGNLWCIWDNFVLTYYGPDADIATIKLGGLIADVAALREKATELKDNSSVTATTVGKLETALANSEDIEKTEEAYKAAIDELKSATERANYEVESKTAIDAMYALMENTNVYTTDAYNTYKGIADGLLEKYNDGTLTETVVNPSAIAGWHSANNYDDLLLSAWNIGDKQCKDFETSLYINTWSVEGENDGSEFKVPFFEYWIGDDQSLGANTLTGTVEGLDPGFYSVSAWVRVRAKNGYTAPAYGITMDANEGKAVDVAAGAQIGESQFFLDEFKTIGEVGADGVLKINIKINADNNISWLSFKNVKFEQIPVEDPASCIVNAELNPEANPKGWTENVSGGFRDFGMGKIGTYNVRFSPATVDETHLETEFCAGFEARWEGNFASYQQTTGTLAPGYYELTYDVENVNADTYNLNYNNLFTVTVGDKVFTDKSTEWMKGKSAWTKHSIKFRVDELSPITVSLGYGTGGNNTHANNTPALYVSHLEMSGYTLEEAKADATAEIAALAPIGDGFFMYTQDNIDAAKIAVEAATTMEEVLTAIPTPNYPEADKAYVIANTTADGNLNITTEKVSVAKGAKVFFTAVEGGFVLSNEDGEYIFKTTNDTWTLSTTEEAANAYAVNFNVVEGGYTIQGANGLFGLDNATEGSAVYANKAAANNGIWTIAEFIPTYEIAIKDGIENGTVEADATEAAAGATVKLTITPAEGYELKSISISYGEDEDAKTIEPDEENSFIMPAAPVVIDAVFSEIIPDIVLSAPTFNMENGTQLEPSLYPAGTALKVTYTAENLEANGLTAEDVQVKILVMLSGDLPENSMNMQSETKHSIMPPQTFYIPLGETDFPEALKNGYVYQSINILSAELVKPATETEPEETLAAYVGAPVQLHWVGLEAEEEEIDPNLIEIAQDQGKTLDTFTRTDFEEGEKYNTYTANGDLNIAIKMLNVDVANCDYVIVKFAEPVARGWHLAFWGGQELVAIPEGATEYKYVFADDKNCAIQNGVLPQICMMTFMNENPTYPLVAKVKGLYKHLDEEGQVQINDIDAAKAKRNGKFYKKGQFFILNGGKAFSLNGIETK